MAKVLRNMAIPATRPELPGEDNFWVDPPELPGLSAWFAAIDYDYNKLQKAILDHIEKGKPWPPLRGLQEPER
jgi:hypothetical protein